MKTRLVAVTLTFLLLSVLAGCAEQATTSKQNTEKQPYGSVTSVPLTTPTDMNSPQLKPPVAGDTVAIIETDLGTIKFKLFPEQAPEMVKNFEALAKAGKYNNVPFHRVIKDFMVQTGDFTDKNGHGGYSYKGPGTELPDEFSPSLKNLYGTVSMANSGPNTNGSQFFIVTSKSGTPWLDGKHSVFGQVYEGLEIALKIAELQTDSNGTPSKIINMKKVTVEPYKP
jgi:peptidyl-prolyl cis-trans isomerase B (cyclophilin B)